MRKLIPTLTLATTLALATLGEADARVRQSPPLLTPAERLCEAYGYWAWLAATARDHGEPYLQQLSSLRQEFRKDPDLPLETRMTRMLRLIYDKPMLTPSMVQQQMELGCLDRPKAAAAPTPTVTKDRE